MQKAAQREISVKVGQRLRALRVARGISQETLAETLGLTFQQLQKYEKGVNRLSVPALLLLCEFFKVPASALIGGKDDDSRELRVNTRTRARLIDALDAIANPKLETAVALLLQRIAQL